MADVGHEVIAGSREKAKAEAAVAELTEKWGERVARITPGDNSDACNADVVVLAVNADAALDTCRNFAEELQGRIVVSMANHLQRNGNEFNAILPPHGSIAKEIQVLLWKSQVVTAFHLVPAAEFGRLDEAMESDVVACGDDDDGIARAESCGSCESYTKLIVQPKNVRVDPIADDLASVALDMLVDDAGFVRSGPNYLLIGAGES